MGIDQTRKPATSMIRYSTTHSAVVMAADHSAQLGVASFLFTPNLFGITAPAHISAMKTSAKRILSRQPASGDVGSSIEPPPTPIMVIAACEPIASPIAIHEPMGT